MSYVKQTWATGDVVTAEKMNYIENGIAGAGGSFLVTLDTTNATLDKNYQEIYGALLAGKVIMLTYMSNDGHQICYLDYFWNSNGSYGVSFFDSANGSSKYTSSTATGVLTLTMEAA